MTRQWVRCTRALDGKPAFINLGLASMVFTFKGVTRISFIGAADDYVDVKETVDQVLALLDGPVAS